MPTISMPGGPSEYAVVLADKARGKLSELEDSEILPLFKEHGAILFRGFFMNLPEFNAMTSRYCSTFIANESQGRKAVSKDGRTQTVNLGVQPFPMHAELSREPWKPDIAFFACSTPPASGGETLLCDGIAIVKALKEETRRLLAENKLEYKRAATPEECQTWLGTAQPDADVLKNQANDGPFVFSFENGEIFRTFHADALHRPMFSDDLVFANFLLFARYCLNMRNYPTFENGREIPAAVVQELKTVSDSLTVAHKWETCDLLMVDNTRFMHGRNAVEDPNHRLIFTQFGYATFAPVDENAARGQPWRKQA